MKKTLVFLTSAVLPACASPPEPLPYEIREIQAVVETDGMPDVGDLADDPAIWVHPTSPEQSLILGTNKATGLYVFGLDGKQRQQLLIGQLNNVDIRMNIAVASNDEANTLSWFRVDPATASVSHWGDTSLTRNEPYGICFGLIDEQFVAAPTFKDGAVELWRLDRSDSETPTATLQRTIQLPGQLEGCVFDDEHRRLFIGEEEYGIWVVDLTDPVSRPGLVDAIRNGNGLVADTEGLGLYRQADGAGYLVASAQAKDRFVIYDRQPPYAVRGVVTIAANEALGIDAVTHTDGIDVVSAPLPGFPLGVMAVQDDGNPASEQAQNFKLVDWRHVKEALALD